MECNKSHSYSFYRQNFDGIFEKQKTKITLDAK